MNIFSDIQKDFPILQSGTDGKRLIYLDSTATSLKPQSVIDAMTSYYTSYSANIFRGVYQISEQATQRYEDARGVIASFISAPDRKEIVFVRNGTEAINLVAHTWGNAHLSPSDEVVTTIMEHHANMVPWQQLCLSRGATLRIVPLTEVSSCDLLYQSISKKTKLVAITHISNVLGLILPLKQIISRIREINPRCIILVDGSQSAPHIPVSVQDIDCDFFCFSGHKMLGPTGIGVLWGRYSLLHDMPVYQTGGEMIRRVTIEHTTFQDPPHKFEAGTPHIAGAIGLAEAVRYLENIGMERVNDHEQHLVGYAYERLAEISDLQILGPTDPTHRCGVLSFTMSGVHPHDLAQIVDRENICIRAGHHCAMPLHHHLGISSSARASFYLYTTTSDIDALVSGVYHAMHVLKK